MGFTTSPLWRALTSVGSVLKILELGGLVNFYRFKDSWRNSLQEYYVRCQHGLTLLFITAHVMSTLFRAKRYSPEFYQSLFEDLGMILVFVETQVFRKNYRRLTELIQLMEMSVSNSNDEEVIEACRYKVGVILSILFFVIGPTIACAWVEACIPLTQEEQNIRRYVYGVKYPEKRLPTNIWLPGIDESEGGYYQFIFLWDVYEGVVMMLLFCCTSAMIPTIVVHIEGQYAVLCKLIVSFGGTHIKDKALKHKALKARKVVSNSLFFQTSRLKVINETNKLPGEVQIRFFQVKPRNETKEDTKENYIKQLREIIKYHASILSFQEKMMVLCSPIISLVILANTLGVALCLFQLTSLGGTNISKPRRFKFFGEILVCLMHHFYMCHCSEQLDASARKVSSAVYNLKWFNAPPDIRRDILILLRRTQKPNYLKFSQVANYVFRRESFIQMIKVAYKFVNFMRLSN